MCGGHCFFLNYFKFFSLMLIRTFNSVMCVAHWSLCVPLFPIPSLLPPFPLLKISIPPDCSQLVTLICHLSYCHLCCCCFPDRFFFFVLVLCEFHIYTSILLISPSPHSQFTTPQQRKESCCGSCNVSQCVLLLSALFCLHMFMQ